MKNINKTSLYIASVTLAIGLLIGALIFGGAPQKIIKEQANEVVKNQLWTCSMHPHIRLSEPGSCPICGMDLIPLITTTSNKNPLEIKMSPTAMLLANVQTSIITKEKPVKEIRLHGKIQADERYTYSQTAHFSGRIEKLFINYTGAHVKKGQTIAYIYSPELVTAQEELFEAHKIKDVQPALYNASRRKLQNWKLTNKQIDHILKSGIVKESFPILSDVNGVVLTKYINTGDHVKLGESLFQVADLSKTWALFDIYESDIAWVNKGDQIAFSVRALPGEKFKGKISFIDPTINAKTRVTKARVTVNNSSKQLKPEMFIEGLLKGSLKSIDSAITVPKSAIMWTGQRSIVYIKTTSISTIGFVRREVSLGSMLGNSYIVTDGVEVGEEIATNGTFSIDAAAQLAGKPSMMNPPNNGISPNNDLSMNKEAKKNLLPLFNTYIEVKNALVKDELTQAVFAGKLFLQSLEEIDVSTFKKDYRMVWLKQRNTADRSIKALINATDITTARSAFVQLSSQMVALGKTFNPMHKTLYIQHCPMANSNKGADWLSFEKEVKNPYFGERMLKCGEVKQIIK